MANMPGRRRLRSAGISREIALQNAARSLERAKGTSGGGAALPTRAIGYRDRSKLLFTDTQVLALVRSSPGLNLYQIQKAAQSKMPQWNWSIGKIQKAVGRLKELEKVDTETILSGGRACVIVRPCKK